MRRARIGMIAISICCLSIQAWSQESKNVTRTWESRNGAHSIRAAFVGYDSSSRQVTLGLEDGSEVDVSIDDLSGRDKSYVSGFLPKQPPLPEILKPKNSGSKEDDSTPASTSADRRKNTRPKSLGGTNLFGVNWQTDPNRALQLAEGREGPADDRPVVWFRVLGDLTGLM